MKRLAQRKRDKAGIFIVLAAIGIVLANIVSAPAPSTAADPAPPSSPATDYYKPVSEVAGAETTVVVPRESTVTINNQPAQKTDATKLEVTIPPSGPGMPAPETIVINLRTPLTYTLKAGQQSPVLSHEMVDHVQYEWRSSTASYWQNETPDPSMTVWATIAHPKPASPFVSDKIDFTVQAAATAKPGIYNTEIVVVLRPYVTAGIPLQVTIE